jgi:hypothetical protein
MMTGEEGLDSLARCFFSLMTDLARSYIDIFGLDGVMDLGVSGRETGDDEGVERINGGGVEGSVGGGIKGGGWEIRTAGGVGGINGGGGGINGGGGGINGGGIGGANGGGWEIIIGVEHFEAVVNGVVRRASSL